MSMGFGYERRTQPESKRVGASPVDAVGKSTLVQREPAPVDSVGEPLDVVQAERAAGRGDSAAAIRALRALFGANRSPERIAEVVVRIESSAIASSEPNPIDYLTVASTLGAVTADARRGYERALTQPIATLIAALQLLHQKRCDAVAVVRGYLAAGRSMDTTAVKALAYLLGLCKRSMAAVEQLIDGSSSTRIDGDQRNIDEPTVEPTILGLPLERQVAYRAAFAMLDGKRSPAPRAPDPRTPDPRTPNPQAPNQPHREAERTVAAVPVSSATGGVMEREAGWGPPVAVALAEIQSLPVDLRNAALGIALLVQAGVPEPIARWVATCTGEPPNQIKAIAELEEDRSASMGNRRPVLRDHAFHGGYQGYAIRHDNMIMSGLEIETAAKANGTFTLRLSLAFYSTYVAPLLADTSAPAWIAADLRAEGLDRQLAQLEDQDATYFAATGRHNPELMFTILRLKGQRLELRSWANDMRTGKINSTTETGRLVKEVDRLDTQLASTQQQLVTARAELADAQRDAATIREQAKTSIDATDRRADAMSQMTYQMRSDDAARKVRELEARVAQLKDERYSTQAAIDDPGNAVLTEERVRQRLRRDQERFETEDGSYRFTSTPKAMVTAAGAAVLGVKARMWALAGGVESIGGMALSGLTGDPRYVLAGTTLQQQAYDNAAYWDGVGAEQTEKARRILGDTATTMIEILTSTALTLALVAPLALAGAVAGGAAAGAVGVSSLAGETVGTMAVMGGTGALMASDKSTEEWLASGVIMGIMPLFGLVPGGMIPRVLVAFVGGAALDAATQVEWSAAMTEYERTGSIKDAAKVGVRNVKVASVLTNGLLNAFMVAASGPPRTSTIRCGDEFFRVTRTGVERTKATTQPAIRVNAEELASLKTTRGQGYGGGGSTKPRREARRHVGRCSGQQAEDRAAPHQAFGRRAGRQTDRCGAGGARQSENDARAARRAARGAGARAGRRSDRDRAARNRGDRCS